MLTLDHLIITAPDLVSGVDWAEAQLGLPIGPGGRHDLMSTHNRLLSLGPELYLEVIAIEPGAAPAPMPRWFALDDSPQAPGLTHWACCCPQLAEALAAAPAGHGQPKELARGDLRWTMAITDHLPFDDAYPALLSWQSPIPAPQLADVGARLSKLVVSHPEALALRRALAGQLSDPRVVIVEGAPGLSAHIDTPNGPRRL